MKFIYPPLPLLITRTQALFQRLNDDPDVVAELKMNGTHLLLHRFADGHFEFWNRHGKKLSYTPSDSLVAHLNALNWPNGDCLLDGELLHTKVKSTKHIIVLWDVFIWDGKFLNGTTLRERKYIVDGLFGGQKWPDLYPSELYATDFQKVYDTYTPIEEVEGLVMKRLSAKLQFGTNDHHIVTWMWKVRKPTKNYRF